MRKKYATRNEFNRKSNTFYAFQNNFLFSDKNDKQQNEHKLSPAKWSKFRKKNKTKQTSVNNQLNPLTTVIAGSTLSTGSLFDDVIQNHNICFPFFFCQERTKEKTMKINKYFINELSNVF